MKREAEVEDNYKVLNYKPENVRKTNLTLTIWVFWDYLRIRKIQLNQLSVQMDPQRARAELNGQSH